MAISPVQIYQQPQSFGLQSIFGDGRNVLTNVLQNAIQLGRDAANNQTQQERDFLGERARLDSLRQRRGEFATEQAMRTAQFARNAFESDRSFIAGQEQFNTARADRLTDQARDDVFRQQQLDTNLANTNFDNAIAGQNLAINQQQLDATLRKDARQTAAEDQARLQRDAGLRDINSLLGRAESSVASPEGSEQAITDARNIFRQNIQTNPLVSEGQRTMIARQVGLGPAGTAAPRDANGLTPYQGMQLERSQQTDAQKQAETEAKRLVANPDAFRTGAANPESPEKVDDRFAYEAGVALTYPDKNAYVVAGGADLSAKDKAARARFYDLVRRNGTPASAAPTQGLTDSYLQSILGGSNGQ